MHHGTWWVQEKEYSTSIVFEGFKKKCMVTSYLAEIPGRDMCVDLEPSSPWHTDAVGFEV